MGFSWGAFGKGFADQFVKDQEKAGERLTKAFADHAKFTQTGYKKRQTRRQKRQVYESIGNELQSLGLGKQEAFYVAQSGEKSAQDVIARLKYQRSIATPAEYKSMINNVVSIDPSDADPQFNYVDSVNSIILGTPNVSADANLPQGNWRTRGLANQMQGMLPGGKDQYAEAHALASGDLSFKDRIAGTIDYSLIPGDARIDRTIKEQTVTKNTQAIEAATYEAEITRPLDTDIKKATLDDQEAPVKDDADEQFITSKATAQNLLNDISDMTYDPKKRDKTLDRKVRNLQKNIRNMETSADAAIIASDADITRADLDSFRKDMTRSIADKYGVTVAFDSNNNMTFPNRATQRDAITKAQAALDLATVSYTNMMGNRDTGLNDADIRRKIRDAVDAGTYGSIGTVSTPSSSTQTRPGGSQQQQQQPGFNAPNASAIATLQGRTTLPQNIANSMAEVRKIREQYNNWMTRNVYRQQVMPAGSIGESQAGKIALMARQNARN